MHRVLPIDKYGMELIQLDSLGFQFKSEMTDMSEFADRLVVGHWHGAIEFMYMQKGDLHVKVNDDEMLLAEGEGLFVNAGALHMAWADADCLYVSVSVYPSLFGQENMGLRGKYVDIILESHSLPYYHLRPGVPWQKQMIRMISEMDDINRNGRQDGYELAIWSRLLEAWRLFFQHVQQQLDGVGVPDKKIPVLKEMLRYIHSHYTRKITLDEIAAAAGISKSSCNHIFKSYMREPVFEYLMRYRIEQSLLLLVSEDYNITETALAVGFSGGSYYTEVFKRFMGCSPQAYLKKVKKQDRPPLRKPAAP